jgi:S-DNA-T family DNA segregation ATPase FtsK/SpoIIIE
MISERQIRELLGLALLVLALFTALSLVPAAVPGTAAERFLPSSNLMGRLGIVIRYGTYWLLGAGVPLLPLFMLVGGAAAFRWIARGTAIRWSLFLLGLIVLIPTAVSFLTGGGEAGKGLLPIEAAGWLGRTLGLPLVDLLGLVGGALTLAFIGLALPVATIGWNPLRTAGRGVRWVLSFVSGRDEAKVAEESAGESVALDGGEVAVWLEPAATGDLPWDDEDAEVDTYETASAGEAEEEAPTRSWRKRLGGRKKAAAESSVLEDTGDPSSSDQPSAHLLSSPPARDISLSERELDRLGDTLIDTLKTFKVESQIGGRTTGPVVTQFEVVPAPGVKVNRIAALDADLALALRAPSVRIVAPIPGKGAVGVEVPNPTPEVVYLREILDAPVFQRAKGTLPLALGKDLAGNPYVSDLARMPHLLIAGATGAGKSVCINTIITSLVYRHSPQTLRLLMVDPKMVELSMYGDLPHLRHPVVTDPNDAAVVLKWAVLEMERRYALLSVNGVRSLGEFNQRVADGVTLRTPVPEGEEGDPDRWIYADGPLPYIVVVVDELADLMMAVQAEVERPLAQLAQKARAIGIHLIVATQRPSVNVITGLIKANFPCRIAFRVSSKVDSRTILDQNGADALLGNGDMLFLPPGTSDPVRIQGAYLATEDTERLMAWYREQVRERIDLEDDILEVVRAHEAESAEEGEAIAAEDRDALFRDAAEVCIQFQQGSTSLLQRRLRIGYGRAARIIDQLHQAGVLGPPDGSKPREVLLGLESLERLE